jgi:hypothetical protein
VDLRLGRGAYAIMPQLVGNRLGEWGLAYSTLLTVCTPGAGALVQPLARRLDRKSSARGVVVSRGVMSTRLAVSAVPSIVRSPVVALLAAVVLGAAYGIAIVAGLLELQRLAKPEDLATANGPVLHVGVRRVSAPLASCPASRA